MPKSALRFIQETFVTIQEISAIRLCGCGMLLSSGGSAEKHKHMAGFPSARLEHDRTGKERERMAKDRFVEVYSQGVINVQKIIVDTKTGVNYLLASSAMTVGCGMSILTDQDGKPIITPVK